MELFYEPAPPVISGTFQDVRDDMVVVFDDDGTVVFQVELEEFS